MSQKVTPEELEQLQDIRKAVYETISIIGDLNYRKTLIDLELEAVKDMVKQNATKERTLLSDFGKKYGDGSINPETGEITPLQ
jgi:hypothetical protein